MSSVHSYLKLPLFSCFEFSNFVSDHRGSILWTWMLVHPTSPSCSLDTSFFFFSLPLPLRLASPTPSTVWWYPHLFCFLPSSCTLYNGINLLQFPIKPHNYLCPLNISQDPWGNAASIARAIELLSSGQVVMVKMVKNHGDGEDGHHHHHRHYRLFFAGYLPESAYHGLGWGQPRTIAGRVRNIKLLYHLWWYFDIWWWIE